ncbi:hypothetical protein BOTBODRAFT_38528 [Botryobasidium botryosum FD-172 SS1]|uniref:DUF1742-domain-containing protein n=1 Tax=Botryobasidium botryosum (strain FD-172 SS1) TaxID=930990 RepID=A0A067M789_BOTB1|nr:hypothetical protein BOTBODRAFT_38528 [Botryobasidium botryosum FD-172 SS1]
MASTSASPGTFANLYYQRAVATARPCYMCLRPTTIVLATINNTDFLYTCATHLTDPGFATPLPSETPKLSEEELKRIKEEWEQKQKRKNEAKKKQEEGKSQDADKADKGDKEKGKASPPGGSAPVSPSPPPTSKPQHARFVLHREVFAMRQAEHRKKRQTSQIKEVAPRLPGAPRGYINPDM